MRLSDEMRKLTDHLREAHEARGEAERARRAEAVEATRARAAAEVARRVEAAEAARHRARCVDDLRASTASLRKEHVRYIDDLCASTASMRKELASDMAGAHEVWAEFSGRARPTPAGVTASPIPRAGRRGRFILGRGSRE